MEILVSYSAGLVALSKLDLNSIGQSEENVKQKFVVPLLELLGHNRNQMDFEYSSGGKRIDIFLTGLPRTSKVVIDTKNYDEPLENHLDQIGLYSYQEGALLAVIVNGEKLRIYNPSFRGYSFRDSLLLEVKRVELDHSDNAQRLWSFLSREALVSGSVVKSIQIREDEILEAHKRIDSLKREHALERSNLAEKQAAIRKQINVLETELAAIIEKEAGADKELRAVIDSILRTNGMVEDSTIIVPRAKSAPASTVYKPERNESSGTMIDIQIKSIYTSATYGLIPISKDIRRNFPGYEIPFLLETDIGTLEVHVTSEPGGAEKGHPTAGTRIQRKLIPWFRAHPELKDGATVQIEILVPLKRYSLAILEPRGFEP